MVKGGHPCSPFLFMNKELCHGNSEKKFAQRRKANRPLRLCAKFSLARSDRFQTTIRGKSTLGSKDFCFQSVSESNFGWIKCVSAFSGIKCYQPWPTTKN